MINDANTTLSASAGANLYQRITLDIVANNAQAGERIAITLVGRGGADVSWSTGQDFGNTSGIVLRGNGQASLPIASLGVASQMIELLLGPSNGGASTNFALQLFLVASPNVREFTLMLSANAGSMVNAALPMQPPTTLGSAPTIFDWQPN
jgi:hypothetical protein